MLNIPILNSTLYVPVIRNTAFTGDSKALLPFAEFGMVNKDGIATGDNFIKRTDVDEELILKKILDKTNSEPVLITGPPNSGKSVTARKVALAIKDKGHKVICIEGCSRFDRNINNKALIALKQINQLNSLNPDERTFVFIDEPQFFSYMDYKLNPYCSMSESMLFKLSKILENNSNIRLIGVMYPGGFKYNYNYNDSILEKLFPEKNHIVIPEPGRVLIVEILNNILKLAGFNPVPNFIHQYVYHKEEPLKIRFFLKNLAKLIGNNCNGDINKPETIEQSIWQQIV